MPVVSIILPTYNRATFLPQAVKSIQSQSFTDWELIIVDDGSTDNTAHVVKEIASSLPQSILYVHQSNGGPARARNTGLDHVRGEFVAFFDSDDLWLPHHLANCLAAFKACPELDWVYAATKGIRLSDGATVWESSFYDCGKPRGFLTLANRLVGSVHLITDPHALDEIFSSGLHAGLQASVLRAEVFHKMRLPDLRIGEDQIFGVQALAAGRRLGYLDDVHVIYHCHDGHASLAGSKDSEVHARRLESLTEAYESFAVTLNLSKRQKRLLYRRIAANRFWTLGYSLLWQNGHRREALVAFRKGLKAWPWSLACWKTYFLARLRTILPFVSNPSHVHG